MQNGAVVQQWSLLRRRQATKVDPYAEERDRTDAARNGDVTRHVAIAVRGGSVARVVNGPFYRDR